MRAPSDPPADEAEASCADLAWEPKAGEKHPENKIYPGLLKVWQHPPRSGSVHRHERQSHGPGVSFLVPIMDWHSRKGLSLRRSNAMDAGFCFKALKEALARHGPPETCNSAQGLPCTSTAFTEVQLDAGAKISRNGRGRWIENRIIESLWRSLKCDCVFLNALKTGSLPRVGTGARSRCHSEKRPFSSHELLTPAKACETANQTPEPAARHELHAKARRSGKPVEDARPVLMNRENLPSTV